MLTNPDRYVELIAAVEKDIAAATAPLLKKIAELQAKLDCAIELTPAELQSGLNRVRWAEGLIKQLPENHDGRNSWLLNYGSDKEQRQAEWKLKNGKTECADNDVWKQVPRVNTRST